MDSKPLELLFIIDYFHRTGGTERHLTQLVSGLRKLGFGVTVVVFDLGDNPLIDQMRADGAEVIDLPVGKEYVPNAVRQATQLIALIRRRRFALVQTYHQKADTYGAVTAWLAGAPVLISSKRDTGELRNPLHVFLNRRLARLFDAFIMAADRVRCAVVERDRIASGYIRTIYNGTDVEYFHPPTKEARQTARTRMNLSENDLVVGMIAGFRPEKDHYTFFSAMTQIAHSIPTLRILAVGGGPLLKQFLEATERTELRGRVIFAGDVADVRSCIWSMDIGCLAPKSNEGFSNAVIEQMACGLPMVVTDIGGNAEAVVDGKCGVVVPAGDPAQLGDAIASLCRDEQLRARYGRAARLRAESVFSIERMCAAHVQLYEELCPGLYASR